MCTECLIGDSEKLVPGRSESAQPAWVYPMTARHSAGAAERLSLKISRLTRWRYWLKGLWTEAWTAVNFGKVFMRRKRAIARSCLRKGWCEFAVNSLPMLAPLSRPMSAC